MGNGAVAWRVVQCRTLIDLGYHKARRRSLFARSSCSDELLSALSTHSHSFILLDMTTVPADITGRPTPYPSVRWLGTAMMRPRRVSGRSERSRRLHRTWYARPIPTRARIPGTRGHVDIVREVLGASARCMRRDPRPARTKDARRHRHGRKRTRDAPHRRQDARASMPAQHHDQPDVDERSSELEPRRARHVLAHLTPPTMRVRARVGHTKVSLF